MEEKKGLTAEEREALIEKSTAPEASPGTPNDDQIFSPEPVEITLGERKYKMLPLKLKQMRVLIRLSKVNLQSFDEEQLQVVVDCIGAILKEPDKEFIEENIDIPTLTRIFEEIQRVNYSGVPSPKKGDTAKAGN